jgi:hypothetical protein
MVTASGRERDGTAGSQRETMQVRSNGIPLHPLLKAYKL